MRKMLVNIRGCNGSGKSTFPNSMRQISDWEIVGDKGKEVTVFKDISWVALGKYNKTSGGMDRYKNFQIMNEALAFAAQEFPEHDILMEGVMFSTVKAPTIDTLKPYHKDRNILILVLAPPLEVCLQRILERNGGKPINESILRNKWRTVNNSVEYFREAGFNTIRVDTSRVKRERMLPNFLREVEKHRAMGS